MRGKDEVEEGFFYRMHARKHVYGQQTHAAHKNMLIFTSTS